MSLPVRQAMPQDIRIVTDILREAARWLEQSRMPTWQDGVYATCRIMFSPP